ncbi:hypothetical protein [Stenotrophomonas sp.]|uniref:hypothetical protein n=1 Tax=Stenotrophomonas sp. TaxID=69392 RepID=UPI0028A8E3E0|nr:hypothetical protein [Stenotrophomonas sp.]
MRTLGKLFIIITALLALAVAFAWKHFTKPAPAEQASAATIDPSAGPTSAQSRTTTPGTRSTSAPAAVDAARAFQSLKQCAKAGDAVAQRLLAETYDACLVPNLFRDRFLQWNERARQDRPEQAAELDRIAQKRIALCDAVDGGAIIPQELIRGWYEQAAANGDLAARARGYGMQRTPLDAATATQLLDDVVASRDPAAMRSLGATLTSSITANIGDPYRGLVTGPLAGEAWVLAACRMGYDCGPDSMDMANLCLLGGRCLGESSEEMMFATTKTDAERAALEQKIQQILEAVDP